MLNKPFYADPQNHIVGLARNADGTPANEVDMIKYPGVVPLNFYEALVLAGAPSEFEDVTAILQNQVPGYKEGEPFAQDAESIRDFCRNLLVDVNDPKIFYMDIKDIMQERSMLHACELIPGLVSQMIGVKSDCLTVQDAAPKNMPLIQRTVIRFNDDDTAASFAKKAQEINGKPLPKRHPDHYQLIGKLSFQ